MKRAYWEKIHKTNVGHECGWHMEDLPDQVVALLESPRVIKGRALDLVGDATGLPFPDDSFDFLFDRDCLLTIPVDRWPDNFRNIERVMKTGAYYQVFYRKGRLPSRPYRHWQRPGRGRRSTLRRLLSKARRLTMSRPHPPPLKLECLPSTFECETTETVPFASRSGAQVEYTHIICRKS